jgi:hypothetical protein
VVTWTAIDSSGSLVAGVKVNNVSIFGTALGTGTGASQEPVGPFMLVPGPNA